MGIMSNPAWPPVNEVTIHDGQDGQLVREIKRKLGVLVSILCSRKNTAMVGDL